MLFEIFVASVSLVVLVKASDAFVDSSARIARIFGVSELTVGLTLVAIGTSLPELLASVFASLADVPELAIGNVLGSNLANLGIVLAAGIMVSRIKPGKEFLYRDAYVMLLAILGLAAALFNGTFSRFEGFLLIFLWLAYTMFVFKKRRRYTKKYGFEHFIDYLLKAEYIRELAAMGIGFAAMPLKVRAIKFKKEVLKNAVIFVFSLALLFISAKMLVSSSEALASKLGISAALIGFTMIAIGTSLPELSVSISAAKLEKPGILFGNVIGSCITNALLVAGTSAFITPTKVPKAMVFSALLVLFYSIFFVLAAKSKEHLSKGTALTLILTYLLSLYLIYSWSA